MYFIFTTNRWGSFWLTVSESQFDPAKFAHTFYFKAKNRKVAAERALEHGLPTRGLV